MGKLISSINITIDGFCDHSNVIADEQHHRFAADLLKKSDLVLLGRKTYQLFESYWPMAATDHSLAKPILEFAQLLDNVDKIVISKTLKKTQWKKTTVLKDLDFKGIREFKEKTNNYILVFGSPSIISELTNLDLINEFYFSVQPIISGKSNHLFDTINLKKGHHLKLLDIKRFDSGTVILHYQKTDKKMKENKV